MAPVGKIGVGKFGNTPPVPQGRAACHDRFTQAYTASCSSGEGCAATTAVCLTHPRGTDRYAVVRTAPGRKVNVAQLSDYSACSQIIHYRGQRVGWKRLLEELRLDDLVAAQTWQPARIVESLFCPPRPVIQRPSVRPFVHNGRCGFANSCPCTARSS
jgi:hypothetical protein